MPFAPEDGSLAPSLSANSPTVYVSPSIPTFENVATWATLSPVNHFYIVQNLLTGLNSDNVVNFIQVST